MRSSGASFMVRWALLISPWLACAPLVGGARSFGTSEDAGTSGGLSGGGTTGGGLSGGGISGGGISGGGISGGGISGGGLSGGGLSGGGDSDAGAVAHDAGSACASATPDGGALPTADFDALLASAWRADCVRFLTCHPGVFASVDACVADARVRRAAEVVPTTLTLAYPRPSPALDDRVARGFVSIDLDAGAACLARVDAGVLACPNSGSQALDSQLLGIASRALSTCPGLLVGRLPLGATCGYDEDCAAGTCVRDVDNWYGELTSAPGTCRRPGELGGRCGPWPVTPNTCAAGLGCDGNGVCRALLPLGARCFAQEPRVANAWCTADDQGPGQVGTVELLPLAGEACPLFRCAAELRCLSGTCTPRTPLPGAGAPCLSSQPQCAGGHRCVGNTCTPFSAEHQPCGAAGCDTARSFSCSTITRTCEHPQAVDAGQPCLPSDVCANGTTCVNAVEIAMAVGTRGVCKLVEPGDRCTDVSGCLHLVANGANVVGRCAVAAGSPSPLTPGHCAVPMPGSSCLIDTDCVTTERCQRLRCEPRLGIAARCSGPRDCLPGSMCLNDAQGGSCQPIAGLGQACQVSPSLANQTTCRQGACVSGVCTATPLPPTRLLSAGSICSLGSECTSGRCNACAGRCE